MKLLLCLLVLVLMAPINPAQAFSKKPPQEVQPATKKAQEDYAASQEQMQQAKKEKKALGKLIDERNNKYREAYRAINFSPLEKCLKHNDSRSRKLSDKKSKKNAEAYAEAREKLKAVIADEDVILTDHPDAPTISSRFWEKVRTYGTWFETYNPRLLLAQIDYCDTSLPAREAKTEAEAQLTAYQKEIDARKQYLVGEGKRDAKDFKADLEQMDKLRNNLAALSTTGAPKPVPNSSGVQDGTQE